MSCTGRFSRVGSIRPETQNYQRMKAKLFFLALMTFLCIEGFAQKGGGKLTVTGTVLDASGNPVSNAIVLIDGEQTSSRTNAEGKYKVKVKDDAESLAILTFSNGMIGELIAGRTEINFKFGSTVLNSGLEEGTGEEAINTGYGVTRKRDLTTQVSKIDGTDKKYKSYSNIYEMIQRECSGVTVNNGRVIIQDSRNMQGHVPPLFVVDGTYVDNISHIAPSTVESIEVLKGTSASIYGSRGFGGAIVIKTKLSGR